MTEWIILRGTKERQKHNAFVRSIDKAMWMSELERV